MGKVSKSAQIAPKILEIMKQEFDKTGTKSIRSIQLIGLGMYNTINPSDLFYQLNKLIKKGFVQKTIIDPRHVYYSLSELDVGFMIDHLNNDNVMSDYDTFKNHVLKWEEAKDGRPFIKAAIEEYVRNTIHDGITASSFQRYFKRMMDEELIERIGFVHKKSELYHIGNVVYRLHLSHHHKVENISRYPTIKDAYELMIIKFLLEVPDNKLLWNDLRSRLEEKCGPINNGGDIKTKPIKALNNLLSKRYITRSFNPEFDSKKGSQVFYTLSDLYDFNSAIKDFNGGWKRRHQSKALLTNKTNNYI